MTRRARFARALIAAALVAAVALAGCAKPETAEQPTVPGIDPKEFTAAKIGVLPTEDSLPLWVAEQDNLFQRAGIPKVEIVMFQSAQERDAALASGAIDGFMGDLIAAANLEAAGTPVTVLTLMLGSDPSQGRFGIVASPKNGPKTLAEAAKSPIGTSSATIQEYVLEGLLDEAGIDPAKVKREEVKKVPVRFELLMNGKLKSAALPEPFLSLAEASGAKILAEDTSSKKNLSQTVLVMSDKFLTSEAAVNTADGILAAWDEAAGRIGANPEKFRALLIARAKLPEKIATSYKIQTYPAHGLPAQAEVDAILKWMKAKEYLKTNVSFEDLTLVTPPK